MQINDAVWVINGPHTGKYGIVIGFAGNHYIVRCGSDEYIIHKKYVQRVGS